MIKKIIIFSLIIFSLFQLNAQFFNNTEAPEVKVLLEIIPNELKSGESFKIIATYYIPDDYHMFLNEELFSIDLDDRPGLILQETQYPVDEAELLLGIPAFNGTVTISREVSISENFDTEELSLEVFALYQICEDDGTCLLPASVSFEKKIIINGSADVESSPIFVILWYVFLAFSGGVILNIMPCVLPLLSVKALNLIEQSSHDKSAIFKSSLLYGLGILVSFLALAFTVIVLKSSGELFGWGFQFQNPLFVLILLTIIFIFSLSLFDVFTINPPRKASDKAGSLRAGKSYGGSFLTGIFAVLVATPCTAPFMGAALGFAFSQTPLIIIVIFTSLSVGFALPFVLLGLFPALIKKIPKPGLWMNTFKEFMGFLLLGTVVYLLTTLNSLIGSSIKGVLWFLLLTGLAVWIYGKFGSVIEKKVKRIIVIVLSLLIVALSAVFFVDLDKVDKKSASDGIWQEFSTQLVQEYRADNKPVFIDFYADWCTSCKVNDAAVLNTSNIMKLFSDKDVQLLKGDFTAGDREIAKWLSDFDRAGVPLYILFRPGEEAVVFPEFLTQSMVKKELDKIRP